MRSGVKISKVVKKLMKISDYRGNIYQWPGGGLPGKSLLQWYSNVINNSVLLCVIQESDFRTHTIKYFNAKFILYT